MKIREVELGYVTDRPESRLHLVSDGAAYCKSGSKKIIRSRKACSADGPKVCKKCREAIRRILIGVHCDRSNRAAAGGDLYGVAENTKIVNACDDLIEGMMTQDEKNERSVRMGEMRRLIAERLSAPDPIRHTATSSESSDQLTLM